jgi:hypothetical protein
MSAGFMDTAFSRADDAAVRNSASPAALTIMASILRKPVVIAAIIAAIGVATMAVVLVNHSYQIVDRRQPQSPPGTTFNVVNDAGAQITPTPPESKIKLPPMVAAPVDPPSGRTP